MFTLPAAVFQVVAGQAEHRRMVPLLLRDQEQYPHSTVAEVGRLPGGFVRVDAG